MAHQDGDTTDDLFLELAQDQQREADIEEAARPTSQDTASSSLSLPRQRRISITDSLLGAAIERRDSITGQSAGRTLSRLDTSPTARHHFERFRPDGHRSTNADETMSTPGAPHFTSRHGVGQDWTMRPTSRLTSIRSPDLPSYGRRRPSFQSSPLHHLQPFSKPQDLPNESQAEDSERKLSNADSTSADSQTADNVWDELDDLKSRIKKLELTGKLPSTPNGLASGDSSERPRTATTAPTTIDSSPKHERKPEVDNTTSTPQTTISNASGTFTTSMHPLLHDALEKAKPLLNSGLYRVLEATASEALQIAALTGSAGPQGATYSAASVINAATVPDRHIRRKADNMCRNLTDLCLALCEGKHETPSYAASPVTLSTPIMMRSSPTVRYSRSNTGLDDSASRSHGRPLSRLEARRSSMLGSYASSSYVSKSQESMEDAHNSDQDKTPPRPQPRMQGLRRVSRANDRLRPSRIQRYDDANDDDDGASVRPPSRAMTDIGGLRASQSTNSGPRGFPTPNLNSNRFSNLRETLVSRRAANSGAYNANSELSRIGPVASDVGRIDSSPRDRFGPPTVEEEGSENGDCRPNLRQKRRMASLSSSFSARRPQDLPSRAASLSLRRTVLAE
ncbi:Hypothetical protein R9X50_00125200 [Acrodontium crateriforme]|uniref:Uncharacterized protein n=1 Tax=Acrodontium crateriforme TaxID=150365 RepID=A0AAQ3LZZ7_9PEZI|nr:Hypothetical protein R9X50_00125200 [Acrodontium crateriforme]